MHILCAGAGEGYDSRYPEICNTPRQTCMSQEMSVPVRHKTNPYRWIALKFDADLIWNGSWMR